MAITLANYNAVLEWDASKFTQGMNTSSKEFESFKGSMTNSASALGKTITDGKVEFVTRATGEKAEMAPQEAIQKIIEAVSSLK